MFISKLLGFGGTAEEDLQKIQDHHEITLNQNSIFTKMPNEIIINIASYLELPSLYRFAVTNQYFFKFFFNHTTGNLNELSKKRKQMKNTQQNVVNSITEEKNYKLYQMVEEKPDFQTIQLVIWKPLVLYYFPKFEKSLNIKNWMHVLRRRVSHLMVHGKELLPLHANFSSDPFLVITDPTIDQAQFIDGCEWLYKCPLNFNSLLGRSDTEKYCTVCKKNVYLVDDETSFKSHVSQGHCVAIGKTFPGNLMMGEFATTFD